MKNFSILLIITSFVLFNNCINSSKGEECTERPRKSLEVEKLNEKVRTIDTSKSIIYHFPDSIVSKVEKMLDLKKTKGTLICFIGIISDGLNFDFMYVGGDEAFAFELMLAQKSNRLVDINNNYIPLVFDFDRSFIYHEFDISYTGTDCTVEYNFSDLSYKVY